MSLDTLTSPETLSAGLAVLDEGGPLFQIAAGVEHGYLYGLWSKFPEHFWEEAGAGDRLAEAMKAPADFSAAFVLGAYVASGESFFMAELIRRAKHRDGSSSALGVSADALNTLDHLQQIPGGAELLKQVGFDPSNVQTGNFPGPLAPTIDQARAVHNRELPESESLYVSPAAPAIAPPGLPVSFTGDGRVFALGFQMSLTAAHNLIDKLIGAYRALTIPAEGFIWIDDALEPSKGSELALLDPVTVQALGLPWSTDKGVCIAARVSQDSAGEYLPLVFKRDGGELSLLPESDLNVAKVEVCKNFQVMLKQAGL